MEDISFAIESKKIRCPGVTGVRKTFSHVSFQTIMNHDDLEEGQIIHISALLSGEAATDVEQSPIADGQSLWKEVDGRYRVRVTVPFSHNLLKRFWGYGPNVQIIAPLMFRKIMVRNLNMTLALYKIEGGLSGIFAFDPPQVTMRYFDDWKSIQLTCPVCEWHGPVDPSALKLGKSDRYPESIFQCPRCKKALLSIERSATMEDTLAHFGQLNPKERTSVLEREEFLVELEASRLKGPDQLPDLDIENLPNRLVWDMELDAYRKQWSVILHNTRVIWRQRAGWEGFEEFSRIVAIIRERYGKLVCDIVPTEYAEMWLIGDASWASEEILKARRSLSKRFPG